MLAKRIIPCLDIKNGRTVKGIHFFNLRDAGCPVELAAHYVRTGADELVLLDISATEEKRKTLVNLVSDVAREINIPFIVGGGVRSLAEADDLLTHGADKIAINSAAMANPNLIDKCAQKFGSQCVVVAIDAKEQQGIWQVYVSGGKVQTDRTLQNWAKEAESRGAGEILFTSMNHDGTKQGFANKTLRQLSSLIKIPIIASGGAGSMLDFRNAFTEGKADAALAASVFHFKQIQIPDLKKYLLAEGIHIRPFH